MLLRSYCNSTYRKKKSHLISLLPVGYRGEKPLASISQHSSLSHIVTTPIDTWKLPLSPFSCTHLPARTKSVTLPAPPHRKGCQGLTEHLAEDQQHHQRIWFAPKILWTVHLWLTGTVFQLSCWPWIAWQENPKGVTSTGWGNKWNTQPSHLKVQWKEKAEHNIHICSILWVNSPLPVEGVSSLLTAQGEHSSVGWELA